VYRGLFAALFLATPTVAGELTLIPPIDCDLAGDCYIQQYVDHDPGPGNEDFACTGLSYDGHRGTDFALPTLARMAKGVSVIAAAPGIVSSVRDGMPDTGYSADTARAIEGRECGNDIVVVHDDDWETQYCHLRKGSITITKGQKIETGQILGAVGMSGRAQFPHVHLSVRHKGTVIDPFDPDDEVICNFLDTDTLWGTPPPFRPAGVITVGITAAMPDYDIVKAGTAPVPDIQSASLVFFANIFGARTGDRLLLSLQGPENEIVAKTIKMERDQATSFRGIGRKRRSDPWPAGLYTGTAVLRRKGAVIEERSITTTLN